MANDEKRRTADGDGAGMNEAVLAAAALALLVASTSFMNTAVFPLFDPIFTHARDFSVSATALALMALGFVAYRAPRLLTPASFIAGTFAFLAAGAGVMLAGLIFSHPATLTLGACLVGVGRAGATVLTGLALARLRLRFVALGISAAYGLQLATGVLAGAVPAAVGVGAFLLCPVAAAALTERPARIVLEHSHGREAPHDLAVTRPSSFLSPFSTLFVCLLLFHVAFGFALRFDEVDGVPRASALEALPALAVGAWVLLTRRPFPADLLAQVSALIVIAGFFLASDGSASFTRGAVTLLSAGNSLFDMTAWMALVAIAERNPLGAATTIAWGRGLSSLGSVLGAAAGTGVNHAIGADGHLVFLVVGTLMLVFAAYALIGLKRFTFTGAIEGIQPVGERDAATSPAERLEARCGELAAEFGLTPREAEVFAMLARGRNREYIEEALVVSRNTVKAHVKHIYAKLGIHSHQELIDLVEA